MKTKILIKIGILILISFFLVPCIGQASVVINEIAWMGSSHSANEEWIELYSDQAEDLNNWLIESEDGSPIIHLIGVIASGSYLQLKRSEDYTGALSNSGETLFLRNDQGKVVDQISATEGWPAGDNTTKQTMERVGSGWQTSAEKDGTALAKNSLGAIPSDLPSNEPESPLSQTISLTPISENQPPVAKAGSDSAILAGEEVVFDASQSSDSDGSELAYEWNFGEGGVSNDIISQHRYIYPGTYLVVLRVFDGRSYDQDQLTVNVYPQNITINEFLPNPIGSDKGEAEADGEWIELYNQSSQIVDLSGWQLDDEEGGNRPFIIPAQTLIAPHGYLVFSRQLSKISLTNKEGQVRLLFPDGSVFQEINYKQAPEGQSSAKTADGFIWSQPSPGQSNPVFHQIDKSSSKTFFAQTTQAISPSENNSLKIKTVDQANFGSWVSQSKDSLNHYQLADLKENTDTGPGLYFLVLAILIIVSLLIFFWLKKRR